MVMIMSGSVQRSDDGKTIRTTESSANETAVPTGGQNSAALSTIHYPLSTVHLLPFPTPVSSTNVLARFDAGCLVRQLNSGAAAGALCVRASIT